MLLVRVALPLPVHGLFTYAVTGSVAVGTEVLVPFGARQINGWVVEHLAAPDVPEVKNVLEVLGRRAFDEAQLRFYRWIAEYYLSPLGEVIATATPAGATAHTRRTLRPTDSGIETIARQALEGSAASVLREIVSRPGLTRSSLERRLHGEVQDASRIVRALADSGYIEVQDELLDGQVDMEEWASLVGEERPPLRASKQLEVHARLRDGPLPARMFPRDILRRMEGAGLVRLESRPRTDPFEEPAAPSFPPELNAEQQAVVAAVRGAGTWLLHGVTGAGKTEVYLALADAAIRRDAQVLVLVPEIALTPQLVARFSARFPSQVVALHSGLSPTQRIRAWRRLEAGDCRVAIGARSAVFAPMHRLGLVVVDEENDDSYKQEDGVRYNARDLAVVRARLAGCPALLGSATPSLESWENARAARYHLVTIRNRATPRPVPRLEIVNMRDEPRPEGQEPLLSGRVRDAIADALSAGGKAILLYNRRGYASFVECPGCGQAFECPSCCIAMVLHQGRRRLDCHYCGFHRPYSEQCGKCGTTLSVLGQGTERVEEVVREAFPGIPVGRMDADTTTERGSHARILDDFREGRTRLLVGTQIVAKGHDFPDVHVAAVLGVDHILGMPDFRASERTFSLVTQLTGRAGRGDAQGRVFLQTRHPDHPVFATIGDMEAFADTEAHHRRVLAYPPWSRLVLLRVEGADRSATQQAANALAQLARSQAAPFTGVDVLGPAASPLARLVGRWRYQIILRGRHVPTFRKFLTEHHTTWRTPHGVRRILDVDPRSLA
jgi:primosomal protein N' (replication factor Y)